MPLHIGSPLVRPAKKSVPEPLTKLAVGIWQRKTSPDRYSPVPNIMTLVPYSRIETLMKCPCNEFVGARLVVNIEIIRLVKKMLVMMAVLVNARLSLKVTSTEKSFVCGAMLVLLASEPVLHTKKTPFDRVMPAFGTSSPAIVIPAGRTKIGATLVGGLFVKKLITSGISPSLVVLHASGSAA